MSPVPGGGAAANDPGRGTDREPGLSAVPGRAASVQAEPRHGQLSGAEADAQAVGGT